MFSACADECQIKRSFHNQSTAFGSTRADILSDNPTVLAWAEFFLSTVATVVSLPMLFFFSFMALGLVQAR